MIRIKVIMLFTFIYIGNMQAQILKHDEDVNEKEFSFDALNEMDARMAMQLSERKINTLLNGAINKALATVPFLGTSGVQQELLGTNIKLDELITLNKNYNFKLTACLGNILKLTKEGQDGTILDRAENLAMKAKVIRQSVEVISKIEKLKRVYEQLNENGWKNSDMIRAVTLLDGLMKKVEELSKTLIDAWNATDYQQQKRDLKAVREKLKALDQYVSHEVAEMATIKNAIYTQKLNDKLTRSYFESIYNYKYSREEAEEKLKDNITSSRHNLIAFRNFYWLIVSIAAMIAAIGYVFRLYTEKDNIISSQITYWLMTLAIVAFLGVLLELIKV